MELEQLKTIPEHIQKLQEIEHFVNLFWQMCSDYGTYERAYEACERIYQNSFGQRRYKNYESFRIARIRYQEKTPK
jgi:hypothetical protein